MNVEILKAEIGLKQMVPEYVLRYIERDMQLVDEIKKVSFLNVKLTHISEFCGKVLP